MSTVPNPPCTRGTLISIEGINGVGKTYLTDRLRTLLPASGRGAPLVLEEFSARKTGDDLGRALLHALIDTADGDMFLRSGTPGTEALLLFAIKAYDLDIAHPALAEGRLVIEGRGLDTTAIYQALLTESSDTAATARARALLEFAATWRALPDLTILIIDDPDRAMQRAEQRGTFTYSAADRSLQRRAAALYLTLATDAPDRIRILDRRTVDENGAVQQMRDWITKARNADRACLSQPWHGQPGTCADGACRFGSHPATAATAP
ncbi:MAG TPA: dTMP kinase [Actinocrinis sp.]|uniref:dTMP kinase n=1 Tax=Actinocrinis sp. TaxID=1920516 RepID=UPI002DDCE637|nr:dTMP kinase [Actinocrinis sp.]HEV2347906.1 dTMP kinase [Actinocrinis sp.]